MFWKNRPLNSVGDATALEYNDETYMYKIFYNGDSSSLLVDFINKNYSKQNLTYVYEESIIEYFLTDGFWLAIYSKKFPGNIIGVIAGKNVDINTHGKCIEIDFLCVINQVRKLGVAPLLINKATEICSSKYNIDVAIFTGHNNIGDLYFCSKSVYHRPLNLKKLVECGTINIDEEDVEAYDKFFKTFDTTKDYNCIDNVDYAMVNKLEKQDNIRRNYLFKKEDCFIDFMMIDTTEPATDFFRFYQVNVKNKSSGKIVKNIMLYDYVLKKYNSERFHTLLEKICEHVHVNNLYDQISFYKPFTTDIGDKYTVAKPPLYYYMFNKHLDMMKPDQVQITPL